MSQSGPDDPTDAPRASEETRRRVRPGWKLVTPAVVVVSGLLFSVSASNSEGTDLRPGRYRDLASVVEGEARQYDALAARVMELDAEVDDLSASVASQEVDRFRNRAEVLREPAGLEPEQGPGVNVVLADAPNEVVDEAVAAGTQDINELVVHQQDLSLIHI